MTSRSFAKTLAAGLLLPLAALLPLVPAFAGDGPLPPGAPTGAGTASPDPGRVALIPAHRAWAERTVEVPAVTAERQVPVFETVKVPVYGTLTWPETRPVEVPRFKTKKKAVKIKLWNPFKCFDEFDVKLWDREKCVEDGTETRPQVVQRSQQVVVGERDEVRIVGYRTEKVVVTPARVETVRECTEVPDQWITLGPPGTPPVPGTVAVLTEAEYRAALLVAVR